jgi:hypothetical protein
MLRIRNATDDGMKATLGFNKKILSFSPCWSPDRQKIISMLVSDQYRREEFFGTD